MEKKIEVNAECDSVDGFVGINKFSSWRTLKISNNQRKPFFDNAVHIAPHLSPQILIFRDTFILIHLTPVGARAVTFIKLI